MPLFATWNALEPSIILPVTEGIRPYALCHAVWSSRALKFLWYILLKGFVVSRNINWNFLSQMLALGLT
eukprot:COSAG06_NODE_1104_length_10692_cov_20.377041_6_plen_69_part_00